MCAREMSRKLCRVLVFFQIEMLNFEFRFVRMANFHKINFWLKTQRCWCDGGDYTKKRGEFGGGIGKANSGVS